MLPVLPYFNPHISSVRWTKLSVFKRFQRCQRHTHSKTQSQASKPKLLDCVVLFHSCEQRWLLLQLAVFSFLVFTHTVHQLSTSLIPSTSWVHPTYYCRITHFTSVGLEEMMCYFAFLYMSVFKIIIKSHISLGAPGWLSQLKAWLLISAQVLISSGSLVLALLGLHIGCEPT